MAKQQTLSKMPGAQAKSMDAVALRHRNNDIEVPGTGRVKRTSAQSDLGTRKGSPGLKKFSQYHMLYTTPQQL